MLGRRSRILVLAAVVATAVLGVYVHHHQSAGAIGGRISLPKLAWLLYTVFVWGLLCPILAFEPGVGRPFRRLAGLFAALMVARFVAEIPMLYTWKNWRPPYGMVHDLVCVAALAWGLAASRAGWWPMRSRSDRWMLAFTLVLVLGALVECLYAGLFYRAVHGATTGSEGLWFAAPGDPRFTWINRITLVFDVFFYVFLLAFLAAGFGARREPAGASPA